MLLKTSVKASKVFTVETFQDCKTDLPEEKETSQSKPNQTPQQQQKQTKQHHTLSHSTYFCGRSSSLKSLNMTEGRQI